MRVIPIIKMNKKGQYGGVIIISSLFLIAIVVQLTAQVKSLALFVLGGILIAVAISGLIYDTPLQFILEKARL